MLRHALPLCLAMLAGPAAAELQFCNDTTQTVSVAIGYSDGEDWVSEGWWNVAANDCSVAIGGDLPNRYYYWRATVAGEEFLTENYYFCTSPSVFTIRGDEQCAERGYDRSAFTEVDVGNAVSWTIWLDAAAFGGPIPGEYDDPGMDEMSNGEDVPAPGTYGEPYTIAGIFSHCDVFDASMQCEIHADGWRYVANSADPTPGWFLEDMMHLPVNTPIVIEGDMIGYQGITADVTIRDYSLEGYDPFAGLRNQLQGFWRSYEDPSYEVVIYGGVFEEMSGGIPTDTSIMTLADTCEGAFEDGPAMILRSGSDPDEYRCLIVYDAGQELALFPVGGMRDLVFWRVN
ncbi:MAG: DUF1036 domain-containing protein [Paracoccaceae bacterium]